MTTAAPRLDAELDPEFEAQHAERRRRASRRLRARSRASALVILAAFVAAASALAVFAHSTRSPGTTTIVALLAAYALASNVKFEVRTTLALPTQLVLVPMLFALPAGAVPLCVAAGYVLGNVVDHLRGRRHVERSFVLIASSWYSVGPALVLALGVPDVQRDDAQAHVWRVPVIA